MGATLTGDVVQIVTAQIAAFEAALLAVACAHKLLRWSDSVRVVGRFAGVPPWLAPTALAGASLLELSACLLLWMSRPLARAVGATLAAALWALYLTLILRAIGQGRRDVDCGCSFGSARHALGRYQIGRNAVLSCGALGVAAAASIGGTQPLQNSQVLAAMALLALYGALDLAMGLQPLRSGETA